MLLAHSLQLFLKFTSNFWLKIVSKPIFFSVYEDSLLFDVTVFYWILSIQELLYKYVYFVQLNSAWLHYISLLKWSILMYVCVYVSVCEQVHSVSCLVSGSVALGGYVTASSVPDWHLPGVLFVCWSITSASYSVLFAGSQSKWNRSA